MSDKYVITIDADTIEAIKKLRGVGTEAKDAAKAQTSAAADSGAAWKTFKGTLSALGVAEIFTSIKNAAVQAFKSSVTSALELETGLAKIQTLLSKTQNAQELFTEQVLNLQSTYGTDQKDALAAYYDILSSGATDAAGAITVLDVANKLAVGGVTTLTIAQDGLTSIINGYGVAASESAHIADVLFLGARAGKTDIAGLSSSIGNVAPLANSMNVSLEELVASIAAITTAGIPTAEAVTQVRSALTGLANQTPQMTAALRELGIQSIQAGIEQYGFEGVLKKVVGTTNGSVESLGELFGRVEAVGAVTALTSEKIGGVFVGALKEMQDKSKVAGTVTEEAFSAIAATTQFKLNKALGEAEANMTRLGTAITTAAAPAVLSLVKALNDLVFIKSVTFLKENSESLELLAKGLLGGALAAGSYALAMNGAAIASKAFWIATNPITLLLAASSAAIYATITNVDQLSLGFINLIDNVVSLGRFMLPFVTLVGGARAELAQLAANIQATIDKRAAERAAAEENSKTAAYLASFGAFVAVEANEKIEESTKKKFETINNLTKEEKRAAEEHQKALYDIKLKGRAQEEELKLLQSDTDILENDVRLQNLVDQLGREEGIKAEARLRAYEGEKKTVENTRALELLKEDIKKQTLTRGIEDQTRINQGLLTLQEEHDNKLLEQQKKTETEMRKRRDEDLLYFTNTEDRKVEWAEKSEREKLDVARNGFYVLAGVSKDGNKTLGEIGKAASIAGATIDTYKAATGAYASMAGIPFVGPALGAAAAAAAVVAGLANVRAINSQRFERGGIVAGSSYSGDNVTARVNSGELILNRAQQKNLAPQLSGNDNSDIIYTLNGIRADIQNLKLIIGDEEVFNAFSRQVQAGRQV